MAERAERWRALSERRTRDGATRAWREGEGALCTAHGAPTARPGDSRDSRPLSPRRRIRQLPSGTPGGGFRRILRARDSRATHAPGSTACPRACPRRQSSRGVLVPDPRSAGFTFKSRNARPRSSQTQNPAVSVCLLPVGLMGRSSIQVAAPVGVLGAVICFNCR